MQDGAVWRRLKVGNDADGDADEANKCTVGVFIN